MSRLAKNVLPSAPRPKILTRKECILVAEEFTRSGFKGISVYPTDSIAKARSFLGLVIASTAADEDEDENSDRVQLRRRAATRRDMKNADTLIEVMRHTGFTRRQARLIYLRSYCFLSWKSLARALDMSWDGARKEYDDALHEIYYKAKL